MEFSLTDTGLSPDATRALSAAIIIMKKSIDVIIIPVIVANVYFRKFFM